MRLARQAAIILLVLLSGAVLVVGITAGEIPPGQLREHVIAHGVSETGALNLVSSIYLGYRAFDTFGETIVLLLAVAGVIFLIDNPAVKRDAQD